MEVADAPALVILGDEKRKARGRFHNLPIHCLGVRDFGVGDFGVKLRLFSAAMR